MQCATIRTNGIQCKREVKPGFTTCYMHGGATPTAKIKAEHYMALLRFPAIEVLQNALESLNSIMDRHREPTCAACGYPDKGDIDEQESVIKACVGAARTCAMILDRTGLGPTSTLEVKQSEGTLDLRLLTPEEKARMIGVLTELRELKADVFRRLNTLAGIPDAALIEEENP